MVFLKKLEIDIDRTRQNPCLSCAKREVLLGVCIDVVVCVDVVGV